MLYYDDVLCSQGLNFDALDIFSSNLPVKYGDGLQAIFLRGENPGTSGNLM
jgi:hypothetical protein